jgi:hypothetical protein
MLRYCYGYCFRQRISVGRNQAKQCSTNQILKSLPLLGGDLEGGFRQQISFGRNSIKQCRPVRLQGIVCFAEAVAMREKGQINTAQVLSNLQRKGPVRQRSLSADLNFWFFCFKTKELGPSRGHERHELFDYE